MRKTIPWRHNIAALNSPEGTLAEFFNSHFFESSQLLCPLFINTTTKKTLKKRDAQDCGIWRWNTRGGKVLLSIHMTTTPGCGIAWSSWNCSISRKKIFGGLEKIQGHTPIANMATKAPKRGFSVATPLLRVSCVSFQGLRANQYQVRLQFL